MQAFFQIASHIWLKPHLLYDKVSAVHFKKINRVIICFQGLRNLVIFDKSSREMGYANFMQNITDINSLHIRLAHYGLNDSISCSLVKYDGSSFCTTSWVII